MDEEGEGTGRGLPVCRRSHRNIFHGSRLEVMGERSYD